ncbi:MAG: glycosyltransferase [Pseudomonas sp.]
MSDALPVVLVPVGVDDAALDACLGALERTTPPGTQVWLADDAQAGPRGQAVVESWLARTRLQAGYTRRPRRLGEVAHLDQMLSACGDADVVVLAADAQPLPGWLEQLAQCLARDAAIASAVPWSNAGEAVAWPRLGEINPLPDEPRRLAQACAQMPPLHAELPSASCHAVALRGRARRKAGGLDANSYGSWYAALIDLSLRMAGLGWRNVLCETAFVACLGEGSPADGDMDALATRWPAWHARLAEFLMADPLHAQREQLRRLHAELPPPDPQRPLFG